MRTTQMSEGQQLKTLAKDAQVGCGRVPSGLRSSAVEDEGRCAVGVPMCAAAAAAARCTAHASALPRVTALSIYPCAQGTTLSLTVHRGSAGGVGISLQAVGSTARLLVPDVPICGVSSLSKSSAM